MNDMAQQAELEVHPLAGVYRMHTAEELEMLVTSIRRNGLRDAITLSEAGSIIDGRNRYKACGAAGVEPRFETFEGDEEAIAEFIFDKNATRRDIDMGQKAIAAALLFPEVETTAPGRKTRLNASASGTVSPQRLSEARTIVKFAKAEVDKIVQGDATFKEIYRVAAERKNAQEPTDSRVAKIALIDSRLADLVRQRELSVEAAEAELRVRDQRLKERRAKALEFLRQSISVFDGLATGDFAEFMAESLADPMFKADLVKLLELSRGKLDAASGSVQPAAETFASVLKNIGEKI